MNEAINEVQRKILHLLPLNEEQVGYQVCEKWLKDRKGRVLSEEDINNYQKIVVALNETIYIMKEIDEVIDRYGGWPGAFVTSDVKSK